MIQGPVEIRHLRYFLAVAGAGSFSRAADRLGISQPSVSQQMRELEENLRVSLFQRRGKRILLTAAGLIFQEHARAILRQVENFLDELSRDSVQLRGDLHLGTVPWLDVALVPQLLGLFAAKHPNVNLTVTEISSDDIETALEEGRLDVGLGFLTHHSPNLSYERLSVVEQAVGSCFRVASTKAASVATHFCRAKAGRWHLSKQPGPPTNRRRDQCNRNAPPITGPVECSCSVTEACAARDDRPEGNSASGKEPSVGDGDIAPEGFICQQHGCCIHGTRQGRGSKNSW